MADHSETPWQFEGQGMGEAPGWLDIIKSASGEVIARPRIVEQVDKHGLVTYFPVFDFVRTVDAIFLREAVNAPAPAPDLAAENERLREANAKLLNACESVLYEWDEAGCREKANTATAERHVRIAIAFAKEHTQ